MRPKTDWQTRAEDYLKKLNGKPRALKHYRCGTCRARRRLAKELWEYLRPPNCQCGRVDWTIDLHRTKEHKTRTGIYDTCNCSMTPFPHKKGYGTWCIHHPTGPVDEDDNPHGYLI